MVGAAVLGGIFTILGLAVFLGRKLQIVDDLKNSFEKVQGDIRSILERISKMEGGFAKVIGPGSPLSPTELGARYIRESGLEKVLTSKKDSLIKSIRELLPPNPADYDVQETAKRVLTSLRDDSMMRGIKEYAFQNALDVDVILNTGALWLRDDYLERPRGLSKQTPVADTPPLQ